jgi:hypothetical protein
MLAPYLSWRLFAASMVLIGGVLPAGAAQATPGRGWCNTAVGSPSAHCRGAAPRLRDKVPTRPLAAADRIRRHTRRRVSPQLGSAADVQVHRELIAA